MIVEFENEPPKVEDIPKNDIQFRYFCRMLVKAYDKYKSQQQEEENNNK